MDSIPSDIPRKQCSKCKQWKPATKQFFRVRLKATDTLRGICKKCMSVKCPKLSHHEEVKQCTRCHQWKPATPDYFTRDRQKGDGLRSNCKQCYSALHPLKGYASRIYTGRPKIIREDGTTQCSRCKQWKPATTDYFARTRKTSTGLSPRCKQCMKETSIYPEPAAIEPLRTCTQCHEIKPATREFFAKDIHRKDHMQTMCRDCVNAHKHQYAIEHHEQLIEATRQRRKRNPEEHRTRNRNRKAMLKNIPGKHTKEDIRQQYDRQKGKCYYCRKKIKWGEHHVDHVIPVTREGASNDPWNLVIACEFCNISKKDKLPHEWAKGGRLF